MKISNSNKELARIISENGGWRDGAEFAAQDKKSYSLPNMFWFYADKPKKFESESSWRGRSVGDGVEARELIKNWHQTILSCEEYFHLYQAHDADGWIEWRGGERPVDADAMVVCKVRTGKLWRNGKAIAAGVLRWSDIDSATDIIAYRLHKPEQAKPEFCESVMRSIPEPEAKPTIEQLAADYRNKLDYANRKQDEADKANMESDAALSQLEDAIAAIGFAITPISEAEKEPELVITDWRDLQLGDIIEYVDGSIRDKIGMTGPVVEFASDASDGRFVRLKCDNGHNKGRLGWPSSWRFIRRP